MYCGVVEIVAFISIQYIVSKLLHAISMTRSRNENILLARKLRQQNIFIEKSDDGWTPLSTTRFG